MAQKSILWSAPTSGDGTAGYTQDETTRLFRHLVGDHATRGVLYGVGNALAVTGSSSPLSVNTGSAFVYGFFYWNDSAASIPITSPSVGTTGHRLVLRASWAAKTVRITDIANTDGIATIPAATQNPGTTYDITLATFTITTGGVITLTDAREYAHFATKIETGQIDDDAVSDDKLRHSGALSVIGRATNSAGNPADITASSDNTLLRRSGLNIGWGEISAAYISSRARRFLVPAGQNLTNSLNHPGVELVDGEGGFVYAHFAVPSDFFSGMTAKVIVSTDGGSANVYLYADAEYGAAGETPDNHSAVSGYSAVAVTPNYAEVKSLSLSSAAVGDFVRLRLIRDATHASDTLNGGILRVIGFLIEYTADM